MLTIGEQIHSDVSGRTYTVTWASDKITQAEVGYAATPTDGEVFFIKRLLSMKYPTESSLGSPKMKEERKKKCDNHYKKYSALYRSIKAGCGADGACVPIEDYFREGAFYYTVYQKINSESLSLSEISSLKVSEKYKLLLRLVQGLQPIHTQGVIHGDLKPDNILVQRDGSTWRIRLIDMNDCYHAGDPNLPGEVIGTPDYYSPELTEYNTYEVEDFEDEEEQIYIHKLANALTTKSDIFALGIIFCEFFSGVRPLINDDKVEHLAEAACKGAISFPSSLPLQFKELLSSMLSPNYKERPSLNFIADKLKGFILCTKSISTPRITIISKDVSSTDIKITCDGAINIYYTVDGSIPTNKSEIYNGKVTVSKTCTIKCVGETEDHRLGSVSEYPITIGKLLFKVLSKDPTIRVNGRKVTISPNTESNEGTKLFYTLNGVNPTLSSSVYETPIVVPEGTTIVKAISKEPEDNKMPSRVISANIYKGKLSEPVIHYKKGEVSMEAREECDIYYTTNGDDPTSSSIKYEEPFMVSDTHKFHIKAICIKSGAINSNISEIKRPNLIMSK